LPFFAVFIVFLNGATTNTVTFMQVHSVNYHLIIPNSRHNINKLIKHKICSIDLSFQNTKNMLSSIKIQGENAKKL